MLLFLLSVCAVKIGAIRGLLLNIDSKSKILWKFRQNEWFCSLARLLCMVYGERPFHNVGGTAAFVIERIMSMCR